MEKFCMIIVAIYILLTSALGNLILINTVRLCVALNPPWTVIDKDPNTGKYNFEDNTNPPGKTPKPTNKG